MNTKELIHDIRISDILAKYIILNNNGPSMEGLCPFHSDTKPSLKVSDSKGIYKCFACGAGGDAISFVMDYKKMSFSEAIHEIADNHNLAIDSHVNPYRHKEQKAKDFLNEVKKSYTKESLKTPHLEAFLNDRMISLSTARDLEIGYAPEINMVFKMISNDQGLKELAIELGLVRKTQNGFEDMFKNRIMFPINDERGNCIGFCGRVLSDQTPKYLNSKESFIFKKSEMLYGLNISKSEILKEGTVLVVEGFMDFVALYEHRIFNAVACMGTALSDLNIKKLYNISSEIILALDSDNAGKNAGLKLNDKMIQMGIVPYTISYAPHKDADEFLKDGSNGSIKLKDLMNSSKTLLDIKLEELVTENEGKSLEKKSLCLNKIFSILSPLGMSISASERIITCAQKLKLKTDSRFILDNYQRFLASSDK